MRLSESQRFQVKDAYLAGSSLRELAKRFLVTPVEIRAAGWGR